MSVLLSLFEELVEIVTTVLLAFPYLAAYVGFILLTLLLWRVVKTALTPDKDFGPLKTVTFRDESAVSSNFSASVVSVVVIFVSWGAFTGSTLLPSVLHIPAAFEGAVEFTYTAENRVGLQDDALVRVIVHGAGVDVQLPQIEVGYGFAKNDAVAVKAYRSGLLKWDADDEETRKTGAKVVAMNGQPLVFGTDVNLGNITLALTQKGTLNVKPDKGVQMEPIWLPAPEHGL